MQERYIAAVDLGTVKTALSVAKVTGNDIQVIWYGEVPSEGIRHGSVFNPKKASIALGEAVLKAENELGIKIRQVVTGLPRFNVRQETASAQAPRPDEDSCVTREEIEALKNAAIDTYPIADETREQLYGAITQSFSTEEMMQVPEDDIIGCTSRYIEGNFKLFVGARKAISNLDVLFNELGISAENKFFMPEVTARAVLTEEQREGGAALVEIGGGVTSVTIYHDNILRHYSAIPFGGKSITADIKNETGFREKLCENIKLAFGSCQPDRLANMTEKVIQVNNNETGSSRQLKVHDLAEIINARTEEIIESILWQIHESGYADRLRGGIVLTGGGAALTGLAPLVREMSGFSVEIGYPRTRYFSASGCPGLLTSAAVASVGLLLCGKDDAYLNCLESAPEKVMEEVQETENDTEKLVLTGSVEPEKPVRKPKPEKTAKAKPKLNLTWTSRLKSTIENVMDGTVGSLFNDAK